MNHETQPNPPNEAPIKRNFFSDRRFRVVFLFLINFLNTKTMEGKNESKHTPDELAEIYADSKEIRGCTAHTCLKIGYRDGLIKYQAEVDRLTKENSELTEKLKFLINSITRI